ncbi:unnamed protein product, partial [Amoebophrya sp. A120]
GRAPEEILEDGRVRLLEGEGGRHSAHGRHHVGRRNHAADGRLSREHTCRSRARSLTEPRAKGKASVLVNLEREPVKFAARRGPRGDGPASRYNSEQEGPAAPGQRKAPAHRLKRKPGPRSLLAAPARARAGKLRDRKEARAPAHAATK